MVRASGESTLSSCFRASSGSPRRSACSRARRRTKLRSWPFRLRCVSHNSPSSTVSIASQVCAAAACALPAHAQVPIVEAAHLRRQPRGHVHAIGDVADGHRVFRPFGIEATPHGARNLAVQRADRVHAPRQLQAQHRHAEGLAVVRGMLAAEAHQVLVRDAQLLAQRAQVLFDQVGAEAVVAGGHRRVRGKDHLARNLARRRSRNPGPPPPCGCGWPRRPQIRCGLRSNAERRA